MSFDFNHLILAVSAILGFYAFQTHGRRRMLTCKIGADLLYGLYLFFLGGYTGAVGAMIAALGGFTQVVTPPRLARKTRPYRFLIACVLSISSAAYLSQSLTDVMPLIGVVVARFVELFQSTLILRCGFMFASATWVYYTYANEFYLAASMSLLMIVAMILGILKNERKLPRDPVP